MASRPYDRNDDEKLALELFYGRAKIKNGRFRLEFLKSKQDQQKAREALGRLIALAISDPSPWSFALVWAILSVKSVPCQLIFKPKRGNRSDIIADLQLAMNVELLVCQGCKVDFAAEEIGKAYGLTKKAVFDAMKRVKRSGNREFAKGEAARKWNEIKGSAGNL
jgi:hypothetical protein